MTNTGFADPDEFPEMPFGMSSDSTANYIGSLITRCQSRIKGVGNDQYFNGEFQKFEVMSDDDLIIGLMEEIEDAVNYLGFLHIKVNRLRAMRALVQKVNEEGISI